MLYLVLKPFKDKETKKPLAIGQLIGLPTDRGEVALKQGYIRPPEVNEVLCSLITDGVKYPCELLQEFYDYAFNHKPCHDLPAHVVELLKQLKADIKVGLERKFYRWTKERLRLVYYLLWQERKIKFDIALLREEDLTVGDNELYTVIKPFLSFKARDMLMPKTGVAFALTKEGYIRPALPTEALEYLTTHKNYPILWLGKGAWYAFWHPACPVLPKDVLEQIEKLCREFELSYQKQLFDYCRKILAKAKQLVWESGYPLEGQCKLPRHLDKVQMLVERFDATLVLLPKGVTTTTRKIRSKP